MTSRGPIVGAAALALVSSAPAQASVAHEGAPLGTSLVTTPGRLFSPASVTVLAGETVVWRNDDTTDHVVRADDASFESPRIEPGAQFARVFEHPGVVRYHCALHRFMRGRVSVAGIALSGPAEPLRPGAGTTLQGRAPEGTGTVTLERWSPGQMTPDDVATAEPDDAVAILFAVAMFRASGAMDFLVRILDPILRPIGFPAEVLPMAIVRPLTGSGSAALVVDMINRYGEDSIFVKMAAVMFGSTETTFYVIAVYFGAVSIKKTRHAVAAGLTADISAMIIAVWLVRLLYG